EVPAIEVEQPLMSVKGAKGMWVHLFENRLVISTQSTMATIAYGVQADKVIYLSALRGMVVKRAGWFNGYIAFLVHGEQDINSNMTKRAFRNDEYTVWFDKKREPDFLRLEAEINNRKE